MLSSIFLGLVQGVSEFLPISSSGHLAIFQTFFGLTEGTLFFDVLLHLGTLIAIFAYYRKDILALIREFFRLILCLFSREGRQGLRHLNANGRTIVMLFIATLPLLAVLPVKEKVAALYGNTIFVGCALVVTGLVLFLSDRMARGKKTPKTATWLDALLIGVGQAFAVLPGISRSGTTIAAGMMRGFQRRFAVRFSFLLSIPAVLGANIISLGDAAAAGVDPWMIPGYVLGAVAAAIVGYFAIRLVNLLADKGKFGSFAYYCWGVGLAAIAATLLFL